MSEGQQPQMEALKASKTMNQSDPGNDSPEAPQNSNEMSPAGIRRSARARRPAAQFDRNASTDPWPKASQNVTEPRKELKRRATPEVLDIPDNLLDTSMAPMRPDELAEWESWIELESEPAFFNKILNELGVKDTKVQEIYVPDEDTLRQLPKPTHGIILLYRYTEGEECDAPGDGENVWFANQTTNDACATVALINIIMNGANIELGEALASFKAETEHLSPPMRGHILSNNATIRMAHNAYARRLDLLNADLYVENNAARAPKRKRTKAVSVKRRKSTVSDAYHFIAYVPAGGKVWQLDGLANHPTCLGENAEDWTSIAAPFIKARIEQAPDDNLNLLAVCQSPIVGLRQQLRQNIAHFRYLERKMALKLDLATALGRDRICLDQYKYRAVRVRYGLGDRDIGDGGLSPLVSFTDKITSRGLSFGLSDALELHGELTREWDIICAKYAEEEMAMASDFCKANGRKRDYTAAIHEWIVKLAEHGVLLDLKEQIESAA